MKWIIGLGNPGLKYQLTRHNIGFMAVDAFARQHGSPSFKSEHKSLTTKIRVGSSPVLLVLPQTFMNLSGQAARSLMDYYDLDIENLLVIQDDVDQPYSALRFQKNRGHGGHNGIRSLHSHLGTKNYHRLKLGVGRPSSSKQDVADYVLQNFSKDEQKRLPDWLTEIGRSLECYVQDGFERAATQFNFTPAKEAGQEPS